MACVRPRLELSMVTALFVATVLAASSDDPLPTNSAAQPAESSAPHDASACATGAANDPTLKEGAAIVRVCTDEKGSLTSDPTIVKSSGSCRLDQGAIKLVKSQSGHYQPATANGKPVSSCANIRIKFELKD